jgi:K+-transporting ATPase ATPase C chain
MKSFFTSLRASLLLLIICGLLYPLATTGIAQVLFPKQAKGSLIEREGQLIGSALLAQEFTSPDLFHPRPSAANYDPKASAATNAAVSSEDYSRQIAERVNRLKQEEGAMATRAIPADLVTESGSGLDPHLSPAAARAQVSRIARETGISEAELNALIDHHTKGRQLGIFGEQRVNILELNLDLLQRIR